MKLKAVMPDDLKVGKLYSDIDNISEFSTILKFLSKEDNAISFEYVSGRFTYLILDGMVQFKIEGNESDVFYEFKN